MSIMEGDGDANLGTGNVYASEADGDDAALGIHALTRYIISHSEADMAMAGESDLFRLCNVVGCAVPDNIAAWLNANPPRIRVENGIGMVVIDDEPQVPVNAVLGDGIQELDKWFLVHGGAERLAIQSFQVDGRSTWIAKATLDDIIYGELFRPAASELEAKSLVAWQALRRLQREKAYADRQAHQDHAGP